MASIFKQKYTVAGDNGRRIRKQSRFWYIDYKTADGTRKRVKAFKDKQATQQLAAKLEKESELAQAGIVDKYKEHRKTPLSEHLENFLSSLQAKSNTPEYCNLTHYRAERICNGCKFIFWPDISASDVQLYIADLRDSGKVSQKTSNYYLQAVKQFCNWMLKDKRAGGESPLKHLDAIKVTDEINRRALMPDELGNLLEATENAPKRFGMTGYERAMLYRFAAYTGLRANEIRNLTASSFDFDNRTVKVKAAYSKRRREDILSLRKDTAEAMREHLRSKTPSAKVFDLPSKYRMADMIRADLEDAGIDLQDNGDGVIDFHSLRHSTASLLAASGVNPKTAQAIMRHSDINLTMSRYTHIFRGAESEAVESMPDFSSQGRQRQVATGTYSKPAELSKSAYKPAYKKLAKNPYFDGQRLSAIGSDAVQEQCNISQNRGEANPMQSAELGTKKEPMSSTDTGSKTTTPGRTRTCDLRIRNPLLYPAELRAQKFLTSCNITTFSLSCQWFRPQSSKISKGCQ